MRKPGLKKLRFFFGCACFALLAVFVAVSAGCQFNKKTAFALWPAGNGAQPTNYTKTAPAYPSEGKPWIFQHGDTVDVKVDASKVLRPVTPYQFGNNAIWWAGKDWFLDPDSIEKARQSGIKFWRWPGGSSADNYRWDGQYAVDKQQAEGGDATRMTEAWTVSTDDFIEFCRQTSSEAIVTVNYGAARYSNVNDAADMAARWVRYFNIEKKFKVRYWEIGNEVYGPWEEGNKIEGKPQLTGDVYAKDALVIAAAMKKVDPDIFIGAVAVDTDGGDEWTGFRWWMKDLLPQLKGKFDYLILHQYFIWPFSGEAYTNPGNEIFFGNLHELRDARNAVDLMLDKYAGPEKAIPVALTEFNLTHASPAPTVQLLNGLYTAEVLGDAIQSGYAASNYWDWKNGLDDKLHGDHGMLSNGDPSIPDATPRPSYYAYALYARAFGDKMIFAESADSSVKVYASRFSSGEIGLIAVNENSRNKTLALDLSGFTAKGKFIGWVLSGNSLNDKQVSWNEQAGPSGGGGPFPIDAIAPYMDTFNTENPVQLSIPANSATGIILY